MKPREPSLRMTAKNEQGQGQQLDAKGAKLAKLREEVLDASTPQIRRESGAYFCCGDEGC
jgi:hypothetical protein